MPFLNIPLRSVQANITAVQGIDSMPWYNPLLYPVVPPDPQPLPVPRDYKWRITMSIDEQTHSSNITRLPGSYNGQDIIVGQWIGNITTGQAWLITLIESKTTTQVTAIVQDVFRYNTFRDPAQVGNGSPGSGTYIVFGLNEAGLPIIDPVPAGGISASFSTNIQSRFQYINLQYDYPLYQSGNTFIINDVIAADPANNVFALSSSTNRLVIGRITSISDTRPGWFTINPVQKVVELDYLPGLVGDIIYTDLVNAGQVTTTPGGTEVYIQLRENTSSISYATAPGPTAPGNIFQLNSVDITVGGTGSLADMVAAVNPQSSLTGVTVATVLTPNSVQTSNGLISPTYGEPVLWASSAPATSTINGVLVTFNLVSADPGYEDYARPAQMAQSINAANIPNITASTPSALSLMITNSIGGSIVIVNGTSDINGVPFAGSNSGSGLVLLTSASVTYTLKFTAVDARAIDFLDVLGTTTLDYGLSSVENGIKAAGLYTEQGLRTATNYVVSNLTQLNALSPLIGDQAYVIDSADGQGNNDGEWSLWLYDGTVWVETSNQDSASTDAKSFEYALNVGSPAAITLGEISTGRRVTLITVEVTTPFNLSSTLSIGYQVVNPSVPPLVPSGLMAQGLIDLTVAGTYTTTTDILFGIDTPQGDVRVAAAFTLNGASLGNAQIIVSYV